FYGNTFRALRVEGVANVIRNNVFQDTGGTSVYTPAWVAAVETYGPGTLVQGNIIYNIRGSGYGVLVSYLGSGTTIQENVITATAATPHHSFSTAIDGLAENAWTYAIAVQGPTTSATISSNTIANFDFGIAYLGSAQGLITGNVVENTSVPFYAPSGPGSVVLAPDNFADRRNFLIFSADGIITGTGQARVLPAPRVSTRTENLVPNQPDIRKIQGRLIITQPGFYRLVQDIRVSSGVAIEIRADDVHIDLNGHTIYGPSTAATTAIGIYASKRSRIHITNGSIVGFQYGIYLSDAADAVLTGQGQFTTGLHIIENVRLLGNTFRALRVEGRGNIVRNTIVQDTGGSNTSRPAFTAGIEVIGPGTVLLDNYVYALRGQGASIYLTGPSSGSVIQGNVISQASTYPAAFYPSSIEGLVTRAETWGIRGDSQNMPLVIRNNLVSNFVYGIALTNNGNGLLSENLVAGSVFPYYIIGTNTLTAANNYADINPAVITNSQSSALRNGNPAPVHRPAIALAPAQVYYINSPTIITKPGVYVLTSDIIYSNPSGAAITVAANNVTIDLNNYSIIGSGTPATTAYGIYAQNQERVTIRNGTITGFYYGIYLSDNADVATAGRGFARGGHLVEKMRLIGNTFRGLRVEGRANIIRHNIVLDTGGTASVPNPIAVGIESLGPGALIEENYVYAVRGHGYGIAVSGSGGGTVVRRNYLSNSSLAPAWPYRSGTDGVIHHANTYGIWIADRNGEVLVSRNNIINFAVGIGWHPNSPGLLADNCVTETRVAYYLPGRPDPLVSYAPSNMSDDPLSPITVERDILPSSNGSAPPLARLPIGSARPVQFISGPTIITKPGIYVLARDLTVNAGHAIIVRASDVIIDLAGRSIYGPDNPHTRAVGIYVDNQNRVTIRNGTIYGFMYGILITGNYDRAVSSRLPLTTGGHVIENMRLINNKFRGMRIEGRGNIIRQNVVMNTGGTRLYPNAYSFGIEVVGPGSLIKDNVIYNTYGMGQLGEGVGISASSIAGGTVIVRNVLANSGLTRSKVYAPWPGNSLSTWGIWVGDTTTGVSNSNTSNMSSALVVNNVIANYRFGATIHAWSQGLIADNTSMGAVVPFYTPVRDVRRAVALENNQADKHPKIYTVERRY
ncbi:MAG: right-handed parallel beta-helix repeat-containing protein, partial [Gemmatales bacterium]|nr:right-handed parallel beta-helix repeat-containing protein [Gemmatales bacterium]MDW8175334.1 right-handed parallel beta-helix repeat-containing protein [Gemmatales bacterium]